MTATRTLCLALALAAAVALQSTVHADDTMEMSGDNMHTMEGGAMKADAPNGEMKDDKMVPMKKDDMGSEQMGTGAPEQGAMKHEMKTPDNK